MTRVSLNHMKDIKETSRMPEPEESFSPVEERSPARVGISRRQFFGLVVLLLALAGTSGVLAYKVVTDSGVSNEAQVSAAETEALVDEVGKIILLPDETPTVATVTDLAPLKDQPFFANAKVDDKVLIYQGAKKAILYRPSEQRIIEVAPVNLGAGQASDEAAVPQDTSSDTVEESTE